MNVDSVAMVLIGSHDLSQLKTLRYHEVEESKSKYEFIGRMHRYVFDQINDETVVITIEARYPDDPLYHRITFDQISDWLVKSVDVIDTQSR